MTAQRASAEPWVGCVVDTEPGVAVVLTDHGECRASYGGGMLALIARDRSLLPSAGDWVVLRRWPDGRVTVESPMRRRADCARVIPLRRRQR
jgi:ribosome biogenesis GTPase